MGWVWCGSPWHRCPCRADAEYSPHGPTTGPLPTQNGRCPISGFLALLPQLTPGLWAVLVVGALVVGFSKSALPGSSTVAVGLFALALPPKESTAALLLLLIVGDVTALWMYRREPDIATLVRLIPSVLVGLVVGAAFLALADASAVRGGIGVILLLLVGITLWRRRAAGRAGGPPEATAEDAAPPVGGLGRFGYGSLGGFTTMVANAGGPPMSLYFYAMRMPVLTFLGTSAWFFAIVNIIKLPFSIGLGLFTVPYLAMDLVLAPLVVAGALVGRKVARRVPQAVFEKAVLALTVVSALGLIIGV